MGMICAGPCINLSQIVVSRSSGSVGLCINVHEPTTVLIIDQGVGKLPKFIIELESRTS